MKRPNVWLQAAGVVMLLAALLGILQAKDGRDFGSFYELREVNDLGEEVSGQSVARGFN